MKLIELNQLAVVDSPDEKEETLPMALTTRYGRHVGS